MSSRNSINDFIYRSRRSRLIFFLFILLIDIAFFVVLFIYPGNTEMIFENLSARIAMILFWFLLTLNLLFCLFEFHEFKTFMQCADRLNRSAYIDELSSLPNHKGFDRLLTSVADTGFLQNAGCAVLRISDIEEINLQYSKAEGDKVIVAFSDIFRSVGEKYGIICRNSGNEYIAMLQNCTEKKMDDFISCISGKIQIYNSSSTTGLQLNVTSAFLLNQDSGFTDFSPLISATLQVHELKKV